MFVNSMVFIGGLACIRVPFPESGQNVKEGTASWFLLSDLQAIFDQRGDSDP